MNDRAPSPPKIWRFTAFDTWFFRESRPMDSIGGSELGSVFPPPAPTLAGAVRTAVGEHLGVDWSRYADAGRYGELHNYIGIEEEMGSLTLSGPWLSRAKESTWERLYPAPLDLLGRHEGVKLQQVHRLQIGPPRKCDLGDAVNLPAIPNGMRGLKPLSDCWVSAQTLARVLAGETPAPDELIPERALFRRELRLGIARDNRLHAIAEGMLYQTSHIRPHCDLAVEIEVAGLPEGLYPKQGNIRFGGEGRAARFEVFDSVGSLPQVSKPSENTRGLILMLLTPLAAPAGADVFPVPGFVREETSEGTRWRGRIGGIPLSVHCAILGRGLRQGGWDLVANSPRPARTLIPAGSLFYATLDEGDLDTAVAQIDRTRLGEGADIALGRGQITAGTWPRDESHTETR